MNQRCPHCRQPYRVDPARVPAGGVRARCSICDSVFEVPDPAAPEADATAEQRLEDHEPDKPQPESDTSTVTAPVEQDPLGRARRMARALVSDIVAYHPERQQRSLEAGTVRQEFHDEILESWGTYVRQVGLEVAQESPFFREALNDILARGRRVF